jgi:hypothetical protein
MADGLPHPVISGKNPLVAAQHLDYSADLMKIPRSPTMLSYHDLEDFMGINDALTDSRIKHHETVTAASHDRGDTSDDASADEEADA